MIEDVGTRPPRSGHDEALQVVLRSTPVPIIITRVADGLVLYANEHLRTAFGMPQEGVISIKAPQTYYDPADRRKLLAALEKNKHRSNYEVQLNRADGTPWWASVSADYLLYEGEPAVFAAICDITERKQRTEELEKCVRERNVQLSQTDDELRQARDERQRAVERLAAIIEFLPVAVAITHR